MIQLLLLSVINFSSLSTVAGFGSKVDEEKWAFLAVLIKVIPDHKKTLLS